MSSRPPALSDDQITQILRSAEPIAPARRSAFLRDVAEALNGSVIGDGAVARACREAQHRHFDVPTFERTNISKYSRR
jgi:hypothetical protein